jgi:transketolase
MTDKQCNNLKLLAKNVRLNILRCSYECGGATHLGGSLSIVEILTVLYGQIMNISKHNFSDPEADSFILSKGHAALALYAILYEKGFISKDDLLSFKKNGTKFIAHPVRNLKIGIESTNGSLGHGLSIASGIALSAKKFEKKKIVFTLLGDGECNEGSVWEAAMFASHFKLDNLVAIIDKNGFQSDGSTDMTMNTSSLFEKWKSFGWNAIELDGHNISSLINEIEGRKINMKPTVIIAKTIKGKGVSFMENNNLWHHARLTENFYNNAVEEILSA